MADYFPEEILERIRQESDIVGLISQYVSLKKSGQSYAGLCPFHSEKTPSFMVNPAKQVFHCFGCHVGGDTIGFVMKMEGQSFPETVRSLSGAKRLGGSNRGSIGYLSRQTLLRGELTSLISVL